MDFTDEGNQKVKYNDSMFSVARLNEDWIRAKMFAQTGKMDKWKFILDNIWFELCPTVYRLVKIKAKKKEGKEIIRKNEYWKLKIAKSKTKGQLNYNLGKRHEFLRIIQDQVGKGDVYVDQDEEGFE